jgi:hypothetical protein
MGMGGMGGMGGHSHGDSKGGMSGSKDESKWETINEMSQCYGPIRVNKHDKLAIEGEIYIYYRERMDVDISIAHYDLEKHSP